MIKALSKDGSTLILILERGNFVQLEAKRPAVIQAEGMQLKDFRNVKEIVIAFYETQEQAIKELAHLFTEETRFIPQEK